MKKDLALLYVVTVALAAGLGIAAARGLFTAPHAWNPLTDWPARKSGWAFAIALAAFIASFIAIAISDRHLLHSSTKLEWVYSSDKAACIVREAGAQRPQMIRGVIIDTVAFIPSYMLLIAISSFCLALHPPHDAWTPWLVALGWSVAFAGALDYVENAGILASLGNLTTRLAPLTYAACQLKWLIGLTAANFVFVTLIARMWRR